MNAAIAHRPDDLFQDHLLWTLNDPTFGWALTALSAGDPATEAALVRLVIVRRLEPREQLVVEIVAMLRAAPPARMLRPFDRARDMRRGPTEPRLAGIFNDPLLGPLGRPDAWFIALRSEQVIPRLSFAAPDDTDEAVDSLLGSLVLMLFLAAAGL